MHFSLLRQMLFPQDNGCCLCGSWEDRACSVCSSCMKTLDQCRLPAKAVLCRDHPPLMFSLAVWKHEGAARRLIHQMKYSVNRKAAVLLGMEMAGALTRKRHETGAIDLILPVPLHPLREKKRGYNQALLLAQQLSGGIAMRSDVLLRVKNTSAQVRRTREERKENVKDAFAIADPAAVAGKRILLVDDVLTTGATAAACADTLLRAGAAVVMVLTAARAVKRD